MEGGLGGGGRGEAGEVQREVSGAGQHQSPFRAPCQATLEAEEAETDSHQSVCMADRARSTSHVSARVVCCVHEQPSATKIC